MWTLAKILFSLMVFAFAFATGWFAAEVYLGSWFLEDTSSLRQEMPEFTRILPEFAAMIR